MTSINAMRFDFHRGVLICDEQTSMSDGFLSDVSDKIRPSIPPEISARYGTVAAIGNTGKVAVGDVLKSRFREALAARFRKARAELGREPETFLDLEEMAVLYNEITLATNRERVDEKLVSKFGFNWAEFIAGKYERNGETFEIKDAETVDTITGWLVNRGEPHEMQIVFGNASIMAGYDDRRGFQMFHFDQRAGYWHKVQTAYLAEGSGRHSVDPYMYGVMENLFAAERRDGIDPVLGLTCFLTAVNAAEDHEAGVGGYFNIILVDGTKPNPERMIEINDDRSKLASLIVRARDKGFVPFETSLDLVGALIYRNEPFAEVYAEFMRASSDVGNMERLLRGYKVVGGKLHVPRV